MEEKTNAIEHINITVEKYLGQINSAKTKKDLIDIKVAVIGKNGELTSLLRNLKDVSAEDKPKFGKLVNDARVMIESSIENAMVILDEKELNEKLELEKIDISIDKNVDSVGSLHPLNIVKNKIVDFFASMGFIVVDGPEIETDYYNFEALNIPDDHPAREMQDTFYLTEKILLRTQTSAGQIRTMENVSPPIKMISPGRVYRSDEMDATHSPVFHQIEGLVVDEGITMCDLKGILDEFAKHFFGENTKTRLRPSYFPFTEPSVEVDATCSNCGGKGCRVCKGTGWIEILGAGMVNKKVLANCGIDASKYSGFAFGMGLDRITTILHSITDLRVVFENDIRFLKQFTR